MKKFLITLIILIILGGVVFMLGWPHFSVPPGSYGVIFSKTHGIDPLPVHQGEFRWLWYKLIPTNVKIEVFRLEPQIFPLNYSSSLPSGDVYTSFAGLGSNFVLNINASVTYNINPNHLVQLISSQNIADQESLDAYFQSVNYQIETAILNALAQEETSRLENILGGSQDEELNAKMQELFPEIQDFSLNLQSAKFPDFILYNQLRKLYGDFLNIQREIITAGIAGKAESHITAKLHFDELEQYGQLLTKYPILLEYLKLENERMEPTKTNRVQEEVE